MPLALSVSQKVDITISLTMCSMNVQSTNLSRDEPIRVKNHVHSKSLLGAFDCNQESSDHPPKSAGNKIYSEFSDISPIYHFVLLHSKSFDLQSGCFPDPAMIPEENNKLCL